jgi:hypothetical protein
MSTIIHGYNLTDPPPERLPQAILDGNPPYNPEAPTLTSGVLQSIFDRMFNSPPVTNNEFTVIFFQSRFPRSKKARIRRKWAKDPRNYRPIGGTGWKELCREAKTGDQTSITSTP